jgi:hypothetical protein
VEGQAKAPDPRRAQPLHQLHRVLVVVHGIAGHTVTVDGLEQPHHPGGLQQWQGDHQVLPEGGHRLLPGHALLPLAGHDVQLVAAERGAVSDAAAQAGEEGLLLPGPRPQAQRLPGEGVDQDGLQPGLLRHAGQLLGRQAVREADLDTAGPARRYRAHLDRPEAGSGGGPVPVPQFPRLGEQEAQVGAELHDGGRVRSRPGAGRGGQCTLTADINRFLV